jgi:hypothetical protein
MSDTQKLQYISEHVLEIRYTPNPVFLDYRGVFAKAVSGLLNLQHWRIDENRADIFNEDQSMRAFVSFNNFGLVIQNSYDKIYFPNLANKLVKYVLSQKPFSSPIFINRIGVRSRFAYKVNLDFQTLLNNYQSKYFTISPATQEIYNSDVVDAGLFLTLKTKKGNLNSQSGPMATEQLATFFPNAKELPEVSFYSDIDYWKEPKKEMDTNSITSLIKDFSLSSWEITENIVKLVSE